MVLIEEITDDSATRLSSSGISYDDELLQTINQLSARLALPEELLPSFMAEDKPREALDVYQDHALSMLRQIKQHTLSPVWTRLSSDEQAMALFDVCRLYGTDVWTSAVICDTIRNITSNIDTPSVSLLLLQSLRPYYASNPHPMLNTTTSRALPRPAGGKAAQSDFADSETQPFKQSSAWGCHNVLRWAASHLPARDLEKRIGLILPPTLIMMDDWEPHWRGRGVRVLDSWIGGMDVNVLKRMGVDKLLRTSLVHTISLHPSPPLEGVMDVAIRFIMSTTEDRVRAEVLGEVVEKGIIQGWAYAPSGKEGRAVLVAIAKDLEKLCGVFEEGIVRWMKTIVPNLLDPLQYPPTPAVLPHYQANLSALNCVLRAVQSTGRADRWRGQMMDVLCRLWIQLDERGKEDLSKTQSLVTEIRTLIRTIVRSLSNQNPSILTNQFATIKAMNSHSLNGLISTS